MKLLLHACCGPCATGVIRALLIEGLDENIQLYFHNPNIQPYQEFKARRQSFEETVAFYKLPAIIDNSYDLESWLKAVAPKPEQRCEYCYRERLEATAKQALSLGCSHFSTTLLVSPYQDQDKIRAIGEQYATEYGLNFFYRDWRPHFRSGLAAAREKELYMQKYCGCIYSEKERFYKGK